MSEAERDEPFAGSGSLAHLQREMVRSSNFMIFMAVNSRGEIAYANRGGIAVLGTVPEAAIGKSIVDFLHPDDVERALQGMAWLGKQESGTPAPTRFRVKKADGSYIELESNAVLVSDGVEDYWGIFLQPTYSEVAADTVLRHVLAGATRAEALTPVLYAISWREYGSAIAICWWDGEAFAQVNVGLPETLTGVDNSAGSPWFICRTARTGLLGKVGGILGAEAEAAATGLGYEGFWVEPVDWSETLPPATVTIWTRPYPMDPTIHAYGMDIARNLTELILRWTEQATLLEELATRDPLTGLANRRVFFEQIASANCDGAVLYCDLDHFKPVNDEMGHTVGDQVLQVIAHRMLSCVRTGDVVGRLGGDEFAVLCKGATPAVANEIAERIRRGVAEPVEVGGHTVTVDVTIGIAHATGTITDRVVEHADRALRDGKAAGRSSIRHA